MVNASGVSGTSGNFGTLVVGNLVGNLNIGATGLASINVTGTGFFQNVRVTGTTTLGGNTVNSGDLGVTGNSTFTGTSTFGGVSTFRNTVFFEGAQNTTGAANFRGTFSAHSGATITGNFSQSGTANMTGTLTHNGVLFQVGATNITGNTIANGNLNVTGDVIFANGSVTIRAATTFTTGASSSDRLRIIQNVDHTGDYNLTGSLRVSSNVQISGTLDVDSNLDVSATGFFDGLSNQGSLTGSGVNHFTGENSLIGRNHITGTTTISGNTTFNNGTGQLVAFNGFMRPRIIAAGLGTNNISTGTLTMFWNAGNVTNPSIATGNWLTAYTGIIGEEGLFMTGSTTSATFNNGLPTGNASNPVYGRVFRFVNVGTTNTTPRSGVWFPLGI
jgi:hypothetical protein